MIRFHSLSVSSYRFVSIYSVYMFLFFCATFIFQTRPSYISISSPNYYYLHFITPVHHSQANRKFWHSKVEQKRCISFLRQSLILDTRYRTVLFLKLADAFLMMYRTVAVGIFTNIGAFRGFCHGNPVSLERVQSGDFGIEKARKCRILGVCRLLERWQGQKDLNPRHAVLEAMLNFLSRSVFSPILGICCRLRS